MITERLLGAVYGAVELVRGQLCQDFVIPCVVAKRVALVGRALNDVGVSAGIYARDEKGRLGSMTLQHVKNPRG